MPETRQTWSQTVRQALDDSPLGTRFLGDARVFAVASESDPRTWYAVCIFDAEGEQLKTCTCPGFRWADRCKHLRMVPNGP